MDVYVAVSHHALVLNLEDIYLVSIETNTYNLVRINPGGTECKPHTRTTKTIKAHHIASYTTLRQACSKDISLEEIPLTRLA